MVQEKNIIQHILDTHTHTHTHSYIQDTIMIMLSSFIKPDNPKRSQDSQESYVVCILLRVKRMHFILIKTHPIQLLFELISSSMLLLIVIIQNFP
jgi:hypothetical protein